ncbi:NACHT domain-containing protein [Saccharothrix deserti]|uniref:NACHT domain-containing protein n=1 Tax=Saccharothrix deserti TaxID=2593674 RepID=UPI00131DE00C|nr:NACHT domain-containing protein [Saccharothrix deserti]
MTDPLTAVLGTTFSALHQWVLTRVVDGALERRNQRLGNVDRQVAAAVEDLAALRRIEFPTLTDAEWTLTAEAAAETLTASSIGRLAQLAPADVTDAARLRRLVSATSVAGMSEAEAQAYQRLLFETCEQIAQHARQVNSIWRSAVAAGLADIGSDVKRTLGGLAGVRSSLNDLAEAPERRARDERARFEERYLAEVADQFARFELFQVGNRGRGPTKHDFASFYAPPSIDRWQRSEADTALTGQGVNSAHTIAEARRVLLLGRAGAGKTTFLQWLAHVTAQSTRKGDVDSLWEGVVPFYVPLRQFADRDLPLAEDLVRVTTPALAGEKPERWVTSLLNEGRALVLVDGIDELLLERREEVRSWLGGLLRNYPDAWYVVTTRPSAVDDTWLAPTELGDPGLMRFEVMPLSGPGIRDLVSNWFAAVRVGEPQSTHEWLSRCERKLKGALQNRPDVQRLVSSPLLCSLLCALYRRENMYLPHSRKDLLYRALELLLGEWDVRRGVRVETELQMTGNEKVVLLERFAAPMVRNGEHVVSRSAAVRRIERAMTGLRSTDLDAHEVLRHLVERTGLLRDDEGDGEIRFVHRIFRDFLAAGDFVKSGELGYLVDNAHDAGKELDEVIFMAAAQARAHEAGELLRGLLTKADKRKRTTSEVHRLRLLAAASLGYVDVIEPEHVRADVINTVRELVPPRSYNEAELLARAGTFVLELLPGPAEVDEFAAETGADPAEIARYVIRVLAIIGGWGDIEAFTHAYGGAVTNELLRAWRNTEYSERYAADNLGPVDFGDRVLEVHRWHMLRGLRHLRTLRHVLVAGDLQLADMRAGLRPLAELPDLRSLEIRANEVCRSLDGLVGCGRLETLIVSGYSALEDLSALAHLPVTDLRLLGRPYAGGPVADLATLDGAAVRKLTIKHPHLRDGLHALPDSLPLTELVVDSPAHSRSLLGVRRLVTLETVSVLGPLTAAEVAELAELPSLRRLVLDLTGTEEVDLGPLDALTAAEIELLGLDRSNPCPG